MLHLGVEVAGNGSGSLVHAVERAQQRRLIVQRLAGIRDKDCGDTQRLVQDESGRRDIPCGISAGLESVADTAVGEAGGIRLLLHKQFAGEFLYHATLAVVLDESIVLLGRSAGKRCKPMGVVAGAVVYCPAAHAVGDFVGELAAQGFLVLDSVDKLVVHLLWKIFEHLLAIENEFTIILFGTLVRDRDGSGFAVESLLHHFKT